MAETPVSEIDHLIARMVALLEPLERAADPRRFFLATYVPTTGAVKEALARGEFVDGDWAERWDIAFADLYLDALERWNRGDPAPDPWVVAFSAAEGERLPPLRHVLLGMNAHVNYDLPQSLLAVISEQSGDRTVLDRMLTPFNRAGTRRFLKEARRKVWSNAKALSRARRQGPAALAGRLEELEALSAARVQELKAPGQVLLKLAVRGFGVLLSP